MLNKLFGYCVHSRVGAIIDGYQYCEGCGKAIPVQPLPVKECNHKWNKVGTLKRRGFFGQVHNKVFYLQCEHCGDMKTKTAESTSIA